MFLLLIFQDKSNPTEQTGDVSVAGPSHVASLCVAHSAHDLAHKEKTLNKCLLMESNYDFIRHPQGSRVETKLTPIQC